MCLAQGLQTAVLATSTRRDCSNVSSTRVTDGSASSQYKVPCLCSSAPWPPDEGAVVVAGHGGGAGDDGVHTARV